MNAIATSFLRPRGSLATLSLALAALVCWSGAATNARAAEPAKRPNVIFILADDLGYGDLGCYGQPRIKTPRIDALANEGLKFTQFYAGSTVCAPSRCCLMTGVHTGHAYIRGNAKDDLRPEDKTVAETLQAAGYETALIGKWGLGHEGSTGTPNKQGFDHFFGYLDQTHAHNYYPEYLIKNETRFPLKNKLPAGAKWKHGAGVAETKVEYSHDLFVAKTLAFLETKRTKPFFLYLALTIPHANNEAGNAGMEVPDLGDYAGLDWPPNERAHAAMISRMDADVGRVIDKLKELGLADDTIVFFSSDNGPHQEGGHKADFFDSNGPLAGTKRSLTEGGIRVPMIAWGPGRVPSGTSDFIGAFWDIFPTLADLAGVGASVPSDLDGLSFAPTLLGRSEDQKEHTFLYWAFYEAGGGQAVRSGNWKAIEQPIGAPIRLYDLSSDLGETTNLAEKHPDALEKLITVMKEAVTPSATWEFPKPPLRQNNPPPANVAPPAPPKTR